MPDNSLDINDEFLIERLKMAGCAKSMIQFVIDLIRDRDATAYAHSALQGEYESLNRRYQALIADVAELERTMHYLRNENEALKGARPQINLFPIRK
jgi:hypothetical protein